MKAVVAAFNQEKALVGAFSVITNLRMELFEALLNTTKLQPGAGGRGGADTATIRNFSKFTKNPAYHSLCTTMRVLPEPFSDQGGAHNLSMSLDSTLKANLKDLKIFLKKMVSSIK